jgi:two-component system OmpR family sensor kinase
VVIEFFLAFIFYNYYKIEKEHLEENLFLQMKNYSFFFDSDKFDIDIVPKHPEALFELHKDDKYLYILTNIADDKSSFLKVTYPIEKYNIQQKHIYQQSLTKFAILSIISLFISIIFSIYSLLPLQKSYEILKEFMKDIIHDINTPISAMKLNISLIEDKNDEINSISSSINTLSMIHKNLDNYLNDTKPNISTVDIKALLDEQIEFFANLYDWLDWQIDISDNIGNCIIQTDKYLLGRVIYNILNNACKYNINKGFIKVTLRNDTITISNSSYGIKSINRVFDRFYKESDRGLGIGLHITDKILTQLGFRYHISQDSNRVVRFEIITL